MASWADARTSELNDRAIDLGAGARAGRAGDAAPLGRRAARPADAGASSTCCELMVKGETNAGIARALVVAEGTSSSTSRTSCASCRPPTAPRRRRATCSSRCARPACPGGRSLPYGSVGQATASVTVRSMPVVTTSPAYDARRGDRSPRAAASCSTAASRPSCPRSRGPEHEERLWGATRAGRRARRRAGRAPPLRRHRLRRDLDQHVGPAERAAPRRPAAVGDERAGALDGRRAARPAARAHGGRGRRARGRVRGRVQPQRRRRHARGPGHDRAAGARCSTRSRPT